MSMAFIRGITREKYEISHFMLGLKILIVENFVTIYFVVGK